MEGATLRRSRRKFLKIQPGSSNSLGSLKQKSRDDRSCSGMSTSFSNLISKVSSVAAKKVA
mgnify:FL=1